MSSFDTPRPRLGVAFAAAAAVGLLSVGLTAVHLPPPAGAGAEPATELSPPPPYSSTWIAIDTKASAITLNDSTGTVGAAQTLAEAADCGVNQGAAGSRYLTLEGSTNAGAKNPTYGTDLASYSGGSLGVKEKKSGTSCSMVDASAEALRLTLGSKLAAELGVVAIASSAYLDVELKQDAQILATLTTPSGGTEYFELRSGSTVDTPVSTGVTVPAGHVTVCNMPADSGPDSGVNDHCRWPISAPSWGTPSDDGILFTSMTLRAFNGSFSLDGGADGSVLPKAFPGMSNETDASVIEIVDGTLGCGTDDNKTRVILADGSAPQSQITRLGNADGSSCVAVPYSMGTAPQEATFHKPLDLQTYAQFVWHLTWHVDPTFFDAGKTALPELKMDWEVYDENGDPVKDENGDPVAITPLGWCPSSGWSGGAFVGYPESTWADAGITDKVDDAYLPGTQFACVISRDAEPGQGTTPTKVTVKDDVYLIGDARPFY
jgi:hypothetical protein